MPDLAIAVIGASAGGVGAVEQVLAALPASIDAAVFVAMHVPASFASAGFARRCQMPVRYAVDGESIQRAHVYVAPPDRHMMLERRTIRVHAGPKESLYRPSINALFRSAATAYGSRTVGIVLSGGLNDGVAGLWDIKRRGGLAIVQDPADAAHSSMPSTALSDVPVDHCLPVTAIGPLLATLLDQPREPERATRVMLVEDERLIATTLGRALREMGYDVCASVDTGEEALTVVPEARPDIILMDVNLAGELSGTDAARGIAERFQVPVVYLTAYTDDVTLVGMKESEPYGYVKKPFSAVEVHAAIQLALDRKARESARTP